MFSKLKGPTLLISFVLVIYLMRDADMSPGAFLVRQLSNATEGSATISTTFCEGVDLDATFSKSARDRALKFRKNIGNIRKDDKTLTAMINEQTPKDDFMKDFVKSIIPIVITWILFFLFGIIGCLYIISSWCYKKISSRKGGKSKTSESNNEDSASRKSDKSKTKKSKSEGSDREKTEKSKKRYGISSSIFITCTFLAGIAGLAITAKIPQQGHKALCHAIIFLETAHNGSEDLKWVGLGPGAIGVEAVLHATEEAVAGLQKFTPIFQSLGYSVGNATGNLTQLIAANKDVTLTRIDPEAASDNPYTPDYIEQIKDKAATGTQAYILDAELKGKGSAVTQLSGRFKNFTTEITPGISKMISDTVVALPNVQSASEYVGELIEDDEDYDHIKKLIKLLGGVVTGLSASNVFVSIVAVASFLLIRKGVKFATKSLNFAWCAFGILMILCWAVSVIIFVVNIAVAEVCDASDQALSTPAFFNLTLEEVSKVFDVENKEGFENAKDLIYKCIHGNGQMSELFKIEQNIGVFDKIFEGTHTFGATLATTLPLIMGSKVIPAMTASYAQYLSGERADSTFTTNDVINLNGKTNPSTCSDIEDRWALNSTACLGDLASSFQAGSPSYHNVGNPTCIDINTWISNDNHIEERYNSSSLGGCNVGDDVLLQNYVNKFVSNREAGTTAINKLAADLALVSARYTAFDSGLTVFKTALTGVNASAAAIYDSLTSEEDGMIPYGNCAYQKAQLQETLDVICIGLETKLYETTIVFLIMAFMTTFGTISLFCYVRKMDALGDAFDTEKKYMNVPPSSTYTLENPDSPTKRIDYPDVASPTNP